jgi:nicotinamide phosphoribosyltransferase
VNGQWHDVYKRPVTDPGKDSRAGRFVLLKEGQEFVTVKVDGNSPRGEDQLETVLENGVLRRDQTLEEIRAIAASYDVYEKKAAAV